MSKYKIVFSDHYYTGIDEELSILAQLGDDIEIVDCPQLIPGGADTPEKLIPYIGDADALIVEFTPIPAEVIAAMQKCKVIARTAVGYDSVDVEAATKKGIMVANVADYCTNEVADTSMGHLLNAMRKITIARDMLMQGDYVVTDLEPVKRISEATLCLLGFGNIARNLYGKAKAFFKTVVAYDPFFKDQASYPDVHFLPLEEALAQADAISIHIPLNKDTQNLLSKKEFDAMKDGVVLVNTSRGGLIDEYALMKALDSGKVGYCGLDVLVDEDFENSPFLHHPHVCLTPHIAWDSDEALVELRRKTAQNVVSTFLEGKPIYCVNCSK
jgi:D-3-phosphoglycerate dehydrogenase